MIQPQPLTIAIDEKRRVSGFLQLPRAAHACYVLAHGGGAGMSHPFMTTVADGLAGRGIATLRYQFPPMLSIPPYGGGQQASGQAKSRTSHCARGWG